MIYRRNWRFGDKVNFAETAKVKQHKLREQDRRTTAADDDDDNNNWIFNNYFQTDYYVLYDGHHSREI